MHYLVLTSVIFFVWKCMVQIPMMKVPTSETPRFYIFVCVCVRFVLFVNTGWLIKICQSQTFGMNTFPSVFLLFFLHLICLSKQNVPQKMFIYFFSSSSKLLLSSSLAFPCFFSSSSYLRTIIITADSLYTYCHTSMHRFSFATP